MEQGKETAFVKRLRDRELIPEAVAMDPSAPNEGQLVHAQRLAEDAETLVLATRNAYLYPAQLEAAQTLLSVGKPCILVCLRNPYEAGALDAGTVLLTLGDAAPSIEAAAEALAGGYKSAGRLHVPLTMGRGGEEAR